MSRLATGCGMAVSLGLLFTGVLGTASGASIDFETLTGPSTFAAAGNAQTLNISTPIGNVKFQGGVILTNTSGLPADETSIYGTAGNSSNIGVFPGSGFANPITITFPVPITNFFLDVLNGNTQNVTYQVADNSGNSASFSLIPNINGGTKTIGFAATGTVVTVGAITGQSTPTGMTWDYFIDNIHFNETLPVGLGSVPEPSSVVLAGTATLTGLGWWWRRRRASA